MIDDPRPVGADPIEGRAMAQLNLTPELRDKIGSRVIRRMTRKAIVAELGVSLKMVGAVTKTLRAEGALPPFGEQALDCARHREEIWHLFATTGESNRQIAARFDIAFCYINMERKKYDAAAKTAGLEAPLCACGKSLHHPSHCWARQRHVGWETEADRASRHSAVVPRVRGRRARGKLPKTSRIKSADRVWITPSKDPLYARISAAVPRGIDPALRDDIISEAYLDILEDRLDCSHLEAGLKSVRGRVYAAYASRWGTVSLDALRDDGFGRALIDTIPDGTTPFL